MGKKNVIIVLLFTAFMLAASFYVGARDDIEKLRQANIRMYQMLPSHQQQKLKGEWELRMDMLDPGPHRNQWDR
ncbi:hypothetical protein [Chromohalobacter sp. HP20-39]|uniref:hypothetical protein n=1 Tax=Chromohalobacter sp. HP20-39 TaxID=3079306 RepID=UPI00294AC152|nr:hypothetical protein [Chromohalobacter sp. HP20-39]MDV6318824.1 hypothetical protein [Chromohalobacter sp. HP20-39]